MSEPLNIIISKSRVHLRPRIGMLNIWYTHLYLPRVPSGQFLGNLLGELTELIWFFLFYKKVKWRYFKIK